MKRAKPTSGSVTTLPAPSRDDGVTIAYCVMCGWPIIGSPVTNDWAPRRDDDRPRIMHYTCARDYVTMRRERLAQRCWRYPHI